MSETLRQAMSLHQRGDLERARVLYRRILDREPDHARANHLLGILAGQAGDHAAAAELIGRAVESDSSVPAFHLDLGQALASLGRLPEAAESYGRALALAPGLAPAHFGLGVVLRKLGRDEEAAATYRRAAELRPDHAETHFNLGNALRDLGEAEQAARSFRRATELRPDLVVAWNNLANALWETGRQREALGAWWCALEQDPSAVVPRVSFASQAAGSGLADETGPWPGARALLQACIEAECVDAQDLVGPVLSVLPGGPPEPAGRAGEEADAEQALALLEDPLLRGLLGQALVPDPGVERLMTALRRLLLFDPAWRARVTEPQVCALALQCHWNEHAYVADAGEEEAAERLAAELGRAGPTPDGGARKELALLACYRPLNETLAGGGTPGAGDGAPGPWRLLLKRHLDDPRSERLLAADIPALGEVRDAVSRAVQAQYQANPYPRWHRSYQVEPQPFPRVLARQVAPAPAPEAAERPSVLIAGAGTCRHAVDCALSYADSEVLAVDLSLASLAYGRRQAEEMGVTNLRFLQADLLQLPETGERFDVVESVGVLHHLADPWAGLDALLAVLGRGGVMKLGLYSERGRRDVVAARELIREWGCSATAPEMRAARRRLLALDADHPAAEVRRHSDFYHLSGVRDLLFHVQERRYTPAEVARELRARGLEVLGLVADRASTAAYLERFPDDPAARDLEKWDQLEAERPDTFREMLQIWVRPAP